MEDCDFCNFRNFGSLIYEDDLVVAFIPFDCVARGQVIVIPKDHIPIVEESSVSVLTKMFEVSSKLSSIIFEFLGASGTNIVLQNGLPSGQSISHISFNIIPRSEGDDLNFQWTPINVSPGDLDSVRKSLFHPVVLDSPVSPPVPVDTSNSGKEVIKGEDNYLIKHFKNKRI